MRRSHFVTMATLVGIMVLLVGVAGCTGSSGGSLIRKSGATEGQGESDRIISADKAAEIARNVDPRAAEKQTKWQPPRYESDAEVRRSGSVEKRKAWVVIGVYPDRQQIVITVDVVTGDILSTDTKLLDKTLEQQAGPSTPKIGREELLAVVAATAPDAEAKSIAFYEFPQKSGHWVAIFVVNLVKRSDQRPAGTMVIDAFTGEVLTVQNPPSGG